MSVFNADVVTETILPPGTDNQVNHALLGRGRSEGVATNKFLTEAGVQPGAEQHLTSGDESVFVDGKVTLSTNADFFDYVYGSVYSLTMGQMVSTVMGKQRGWYRPLPDGNTTAATYYTGIDIVDKEDHPGYDPGEVDPVTGASRLEVRAVFNDQLAQYQWGGLTEVRLVNDNIQYGSPQQSTNTQNFQYGNMWSKIKGDDTATLHGNGYSTFQGDRTRKFTGAKHIAVVLGADLSTMVGHESQKDTNARLAAAEAAFTKSQQGALSGVTPPASAQIVQWGDIAHEAKQKAPMSITITEGISLDLNFGATLEMGLLRNAVAVIGGTTRLVGIKAWQGEALLKGLIAIKDGVVAGAKGLSARVGVLFGVPRVIPAPVVEPEAVPPSRAAAAAAAVSAGAKDSAEAASAAAQKATQEAADASTEAGAAAARATAADTVVNTARTAAETAAEEAAEEVAATAARANELSEAADEAEQAARAARAAADDSDADSFYSAQEEIDDAASDDSFQTAFENTAEERADEAEEIAAAQRAQANAAEEAAQAAAEGRTPLAATAAARAQALATAQTTAQTADRVAAEAAAEAVEKAQAAVAARALAASAAGRATAAAAAAQAAKAIVDAEAAQAAAAAAAKSLGDLVATSAESQGVAWAGIGTAIGGLVAGVGGTLAGTGTGDHLPPSSLGQPDVDGEGDTSGPGGFEISS